MSIEALCGPKTGTLAVALAAAAVTVASGLIAGAPSAAAKNGDTHITGQGISQTIDCNDAALIVVGTSNFITAKGSCWGVSVQGSSNTVIAENVVNDITVYGFDQTVYYRTGAPTVWDRGRELGMTNRIDRVPA
jgi:hypothetical protein